MFKSSSKILLRPPIPRIRTTRWRQSFSTAPPSQRSRSWKSSAIRWGLAIGGVYYYNTSNVFAEEPAYVLPPSSPTEEASVQTLESLAPNRKPKPSVGTSQIATPPQIIEPDSPLILDETEEEASQEGAFNEETGEINWDCPCLGGMAHGPCGEQFRTAFSCFVFSKEDPKGMDCIEHFKGMQDCFREHPDVYGSELDDEEDTENLDPTIEPQVDEPSVYQPSPAAPPAHIPEVNEPSVYQSPPSSVSPIHPQVDEPSKIPVSSIPPPALSVDNTAAPQPPQA